MAKLAGQYTNLQGAICATFLPGYFDMPVGVASAMRLLTGSQDVRYHPIRTAHVNAKERAQLYGSVRTALQNGAIVTADSNEEYCSVCDDLGHSGVRVGLVGNHGA
jgi:hypothetical protein